jgi:hypothetical protein
MISVAFQAEEAMIKRHIREIARERDNPDLTQRLGNGSSAGTSVIC